MTALTLLHQNQRPVGELLRGWRELRRLSQLDLSLLADVSTRHLSFVETGRSQPSREMVLHLSEQLELPLRDRNQLLLAAGFAPVYPESPLDSPQMAAIMAAVRQILTAHEPFPAVVVDRRWNMVDANAGIWVLGEGVDPDLFGNTMRAFLHPDGIAPKIVNLGETRAHVLGRLRRQIALTADPELAELYEELKAYPCDQAEPELDIPGPGDILVPMRIRHGDEELAFFSTLATFGHPMDVTVAELAIESFFPADARTSEVLRNL